MSARNVAYALSRYGKPANASLLEGDGTPVAPSFRVIASPQGDTPGLALGANQCLLTDAFELAEGHAIEIEWLVADDAARVECRLQGQVLQGEQCLFEFSFCAAATPSTATKARVHPAISSRGAQIKLRFDASPASSVPGGTVVVAQLLVAAPDSMGLANARNDYMQRLSTEVGNFSESAYTHSMYGRSASTPGSGAPIRTATPGALDATAADESVRASLLNRFAAYPALPGESVNAYAQRLLSLTIGTQPPDFFGRLRRMSGATGRGRPLRMLSVLAGAARVEQSLLQHAEGPVELTLHDASMALIQRAADGLAATQWPHPHEFQCLLGDINEGLPCSEPYDVIVCVSALHHVVELEMLLSQVNERLAPAGEFWSIGEQIGRNGNRLWPDALSVCDEAMASLPSKYWKNAHTGQIDTALPDTDFSTGCFEGIRSEEIEGLLARYLVPVDEYKRNCFLWRLVEVTYGDNFDLSHADDLKALQYLVAVEAVHWASGGRSTELHGVYRKRELVL